MGKTINELDHLIRNILKSSPDSIAISDLKGNIIECNEETLRIHGYGDKKNLIGKNAFALIAPSEHTFVKKEFAKLLLGKAIKNKRCRLLKESGEEFIGEMSSSVIRDQNNKIIAIMAITKDITEREKAERAINESEEKYRNLVENSKEIFYINDTKQNITYISPQCEEILGYKPEEMQKHWTTFATDNPINQDATLSAEQAIQAGKDPGRTLLEMKSKDGRIVLLENDESLLKDDQGKIIGLIGAARDITSRYEAQLELNKNEKKFRSLIENMPVVAWQSSKDGETIYISPNIQSVYGYAPEEIISSGEELWFKRIYPDDQQKVIDALQGLFDKGKVFDVEYRIKRKDGKWIWLHDRSSSVVTTEGKQYAFGAFSEVTDKKNKEIELKERLHELEIMHKSTVGRELKMIELKDKIKELEAKLKNK